MIVSVKNVLELLREIDRCTNEVPCVTRSSSGELVEDHDTCNCEMMCHDCADKFFQMLVWTREEDKETIVSA